MIRDAIAADRKEIVEIASATGLFSLADLAEFDAMASEHLNGNDNTQRWIVEESSEQADSGLRGAAYFAPEPFAEGVWNLYFIGVPPHEQGKGHGRSLVGHVEKELQQRGQRLLLVETSGTDSFERTRAFYRKIGFSEEARIRDYYSPDDDKIIFRKVIGTPAR